MKVNNLLNKLCLIGMLLIGTLTGCKKMDSSYIKFLEGGEKRYSKLPDSVAFFPGDERIKLNVLLSDPNIRECRVYWNFKQDSAVMPVEKITKGTDTLSFLIDDLEEDRYDFSIFTVDKEGNFSLGLDTTAEVYGEKYKSGLVNRGIISGELLAGNPRIFWVDPIDTTSVGVVLEYKNENKQTKTVFVSNKEDVTKINERPVGDSVTIRTLYKPEPLAIDTFYSNPETIVLEKAIPKELNKNKLSVYDVPGDAQPYSGYSIASLWNNKYHDIGDSYKMGYTGMPLWITVDLGVTALLDRFMLWQMGSDNHAYLYWNANVKEFELWGSNEPDADGSWDSWIKLGVYNVHKPSGISGDNRTQEDIDAALAGHEFEIPENSPAVRYIRIKVLDTWKRYPTEERAFIQEVSFYGIEQ